MNKEYSDSDYYWEKAEFQDPVSHRQHVENYKKGIHSSIAFDEQYAREAKEELLKESALLPWKIWFELYEGKRKIGAGVWHRAYKYKSNAVYRAKKQFGKPRGNDSKTRTYKWIVSQTNPWGK